MSATEQASPEQSAAADREIVISRVIDAPRELVFEAFTEVRHLSQWLGARGVHHHHEGVRVPHRRRVGFVMRGPDGTDYPEWISWTELAPGADRVPPWRVT